MSHLQTPVIQITEVDGDLGLVFSDDAIGDHPMRMVPPGTAVASDTFVVDMVGHGVRMLHRVAGQPEWASVVILDEEAAYSLATAVMEVVRHRRRIQVGQRALFDRTPPAEA